MIKRNKSNKKLVKVIRIISEVELKEAFEAGKSDIPYWEGDMAEIAPNDELSLRMTKIGFTSFTPISNLEDVGDES